MSIEGITMDDELTRTAMTIILHAGDARSAIRKAYDALATGDRPAAEAALATARTEIRKAHRAQTGLLQDEARGARHSVTLLFSHAQDTLMTINSEVVTAANVITVFDSLDRRITALEAQSAGRQQ